MELLLSSGFIASFVQIVGLGAVVKIAFNTGKIVKLVDNHGEVIKDHETRLRIIEKHQ